MSFEFFVSLLTTDGLTEADGAQGARKTKENQGKSRFFKFSDFRIFSIFCVFFQLSSQTAMVDVCNVSNNIDERAGL